MKNTCAVRLSRALNYSGWDIPEGTPYTIKGGDGKYYFLRAEYMYDYLSQSENWGTATMLKSGTSLTNGVFFQKGYTTASGHIDVISNGNAGTKFDTQKGLTTFYWGIEN